MLADKKKVRIELQESITKKLVKNIEMTNTITNDRFGCDKLSLMVSQVLNKEFPMLKDNSLIYDLVLYSLNEKIKTVQNVKNVVSYLKEYHAASVDDVSFKDGEVYIKCLI